MFTPCFNSFCQHYDFETLEFLLELIIISVSGLECPFLSEKICSYKRSKKWKLWILFFRTFVEWFNLNAWIGNKQKRVRVEKWPSLACFVCSLLFCLQSKGNVWKGLNSFCGGIPWDTYTKKNYSCPIQYLVHAYTKNNWFFIWNVNLTGCPASFWQPQIQHLQPRAYENVIGTPLHSWVSNPAPLRLPSVQWDRWGGDSHHWQPCGEGVMGSERVPLFPPSREQGYIFLSKAKKALSSWAHLHCVEVLLCTIKRYLFSGGYCLGSSLAAELSPCAHQAGDAEPRGTGEGQRSWRYFCHLAGRGCYRGDVTPGTCP